MICRNLLCLVRRRKKLFLRDRELGFRLMRTFQLKCKSHQDRSRLVWSWSSWCKLARFRALLRLYLEPVRGTQHPAKTAFQVWTYLVNHRRHTWMRVRYGEVLRRLQRTILKVWSRAGPCRTRWEILAEQLRRHKSRTAAESQRCEEYLLLSLRCCRRDLGSRILRVWRSRAVLCARMIRLVFRHVCAGRARAAWSGWRTLRGMDAWCSPPDGGRCCRRAVRAWTLECVRRWQRRSVVCALSRAKAFKRYAQCAFDTWRAWSEADHVCGSCRRLGWSAGRASDETRGGTACVWRVSGAWRRLAVRKTRRAAAAGIQKIGGIGGDAGQGGDGLDAGRGVPEQFKGQVDADSRQPVLRGSGAGSTTEGRSNCRLRVGPSWGDGESERANGEWLGWTKGRAGREGVRGWGGTGDASPTLVASGRWTKDVAGTKAGQARSERHPVATEAASRGSEEAGKAARGEEALLSYVWQMVDKLELLLTSLTAKFPAATGARASGRIASGDAADAASTMLVSLRVCLNGFLGESQRQVAEGTGVVCLRQLSEIVLSWGSRLTLAIEACQTRELAHAAYVADSQAALARLQAQASLLMRQLDDKEREMAGLLGLLREAETALHVRLLGDVPGDQNAGPRAASDGEAGADEACGAEDASCKYEGMAGGEMAQHNGGDTRELLGSPLPMALFPSMQIAQAHYARPGERELLGSPVRRDTRDGPSLSSFSGPCMNRRDGPSRRDAPPLHGDTRQPAKSMPGRGGGGGGQGGQIVESASAMPACSLGGLGKSLDMALPTAACGDEARGRRPDSREGGRDCGPPVRPGRVGAECGAVVGAGRADGDWEEPLPWSPRG